MQNKRTEKPEIDLPELTDKQLAFVQGILSGLTASDAYRQSYSVENMANSTVWANASRLRADSKVSAWLDHARTYEAASAVYTLKEHLESLKDLKHKAVKTGNLGAAVQAEKAIGQASGFYSDNPNKTAPDELRTPEQILEALRKSSPRGNKLAAFLQSGTDTMQ